MASSGRTIRLSVQYSLTTIPTRKAATMARDKAYREAEKKIEEVRRSGQRSYILGGHEYLRLTELPESLDNSHGCSRWELSTTN